MRRPTRDELRLYGLALLAGTVALVGVALVYRSGVVASAFAAVLLLPEAIVLGFVFGAKPGMVASCVPVVGLFAIDELTGSPEAGAAAAVVFVCILLAFLAGMTGALRARYLR